jgi:hypothetical protein
VLTQPQLNRADLTEFDPFRAACGVRSIGPLVTWRRSTPERRSIGP